MSTRLLIQPKTRYIHLFSICLLLLLHPGWALLTLLHPSDAYFHRHLEQLGRPGCIEIDKYVFTHEENDYFAEFILKTQQNVIIFLALNHREFKLSL